MDDKTTAALTGLTPLPLAATADDAIMRLAGSAACLLHDSKRREQGGWRELSVHIECVDGQGLSANLETATVGRAMAAMRGARFMKRIAIGKSVGDTGRNKRQKKQFMSDHYSGLR